MRQGSLHSYGRVHRELAWKPMLMGDLLLMLGRNDRLAGRLIGTFARRPQLFSRLMEIHTGEPALGDWLSVGARFGWQFLTT
jgi:hypothetical protein